MASITADSNVRKRIQFIGTDGKRRAVRIGKATQRQAEAFKVKLESLVSSTITGSMDDETSRWLAGIEDLIHAKLSAAGLVSGSRTSRDDTRPVPHRFSHFASREIEYSNDLLAD